jgi:hypothetical protein
VAVAVWHCVAADWVVVAGRTGWQWIRGVDAVILTPNSGHHHVALAVAVCVCMLMCVAVAVTFAPQKTPFYSPNHLQTPHFFRHLYAKTAFRAHFDTKQPPKKPIFLPPFALFFFFTHVFFFFILKIKKKTKKKYYKRS